MNALDLEQILNNFIKICLFEEIVLCFMTCVFSFQRQTCTYNYRLINYSVYLPYENIQGVKCDWKVNCSFVENSVLRFSVDINGVRWFSECYWQRYRSWVFLLNPKLHLLYNYKRIFSLTLNCVYFFLKQLDAN